MNNVSYQKNEDFSAQQSNSIIRIFLKKIPLNSPTNSWLWVGFSPATKNQKIPRSLPWQRDAVNDVSVSVIRRAVTWPGGSRWRQHLANDVTLGLLTMAARVVVACRRSLAWRVVAWNDLHGRHTAELCRCRRARLSDHIIWQLL